MVENLIPFFSQPLFTEPFDETRLTGLCRAEGAESGSEFLFIKLSSIASDTFGASGARIIQELLKGELGAEEMAELSKGRLRKRKEELKEALVGNVEEHHKRMIRTSLGHIQAMEEILLTVEQKIQENIERHFQEEYELLKTVPPMKDSASVIIAEMGVNMDLFPTEGHLSSWAGMSPGNHESAGKKKPGTTTHGNKYLKTMPKLSVDKNSLHL